MSKTSDLLERAQRDAKQLFDTLYQLRASYDVSSTQYRALCKPVSDTNNTVLTVQDIKQGTI